MFAEQMRIIQEPFLCVNRTDTDFPGTLLLATEQIRFFRSTFLATEQITIFQEAFLNINEQIGKFQEGTPSEQIFQLKVSVAVFGNLIITK